MKKKSHIFNTQVITSGISTTLVLVLLGTIMLFVLTAHNLSDYVRENINVSVLISDDLDQTAIDKMQKELKTASYVKHISYISKQKALKDATRAMGTDPSEFLGYNPFTASFEINVKADYATPEQMNSIVRKLKSKAAVVDVLYQRDLIKSVNENIKKVSIVLLVLALLFTYISFALINNTVRLSIFSRRFIINTMKLVGAKWSFIRRPFLWQAFFAGILSAIIADGILYAGIYSMQRYEPEINLVVNTQTIAITGIAVFILGCIITTLCTFASLQKYLRMTTNELYYV